MPGPARIRSTDVRRLYRLVGECRDLGDDPAAWRDRLAHGLAEFADAEFVAIGSGDGLSEGKIRICGLRDTGLDNGLDRAGWEESVAGFERDPYDTPLYQEYFRRLDSDDGVCLSRTDLADDREWYRSWSYERVARPMGVDHFLWCYGALPAVPGRHAALVVTRAKGRRDFSAREKAIVRECHDLVRPLVGGPLARFDEPSPADLPPRVRQVLRCLLEGDGDKQIAARLRISPHTINQYVKRIFTHFGVRSRTELLARWVMRGRTGDFSWTPE